MTGRASQPGRQHFHDDSEPVARKATRRDQSSTEIGGPSPGEAGGRAGGAWVVDRRPCAELTVCDCCPGHLIWPAQIVCEVELGDGRRALVCAECAGVAPW